MEAWVKKLTQNHKTNLIFIQDLTPRLLFKKLLKKNLLEWHWCIKSHRFQVYSSIIMYLLYCVHHPKSSPSVTIHCPFTFFNLPPPILPTGNHHTVVCAYESFFFFFLEAAQGPISRWVDKKAMVHLHNGIYLVVKRKEIFPFMTAWMDLESTTLNEISQSEKDKYHMISHTCGI